MRWREVRAGPDDRAPEERVRLLAEVAAALRSGGVAVFPTETYYALGADPRSPTGEASVFRLKGRPPDRPLPWIAASRAQVESVCRIPPLAAALAERHWPGPLTLVLPRRGGGPPTAAVRVSSHPLARALAEALGHPVISTSANRSGAPPATTASDALRDLPPPEIGAGWVLDGGETPGGAPSVIVDATAGRLRNLRGSPGELPVSRPDPAAPDQSPDEAGLVDRRRT